MAATTRPCAVHRRAWLPVVVVMTVLSACASVDSAASPSATASQAPASVTPVPSPSEAPDVLSGSFPVADGRQLYLDCQGEGSPTVILEAGDGSGTEEWSLVQPDLAEVTTTCAYDRAGIGQSDPVTGCRQLDDLTADLEQLLDAAGVPPPYVLVAGSGGGFIASGFAQDHADDIAGIVFLDVPMAFLDAPPEVVEETACDHPENREHRDFLQVEADAWNSRSEVGDIPVTIISNDPGPDAPPEEQNNVEAQRGWLVLSPQAEQVVVESGHDVAHTQPGLVVEEVTEVIEAVR
jgi:pimeloyl-ACP methyl ester carboxylesterase